MQPKSVLFARFPFLNSEHPDVTDWLVETVIKCKLDPRVDRVLHFRISDTPITLGRNKAVEVAKAAKVDYLLMIDNDLKPDAYLASNPNKLAADPEARPFWDEAFDFALKHDGPCAVGAPYCGPPPVENVYAFRFATQQSDHPNVDMQIVQFTREEAANRWGFEEVCCLPTGLILIDMRVFDNPLVKPAYFDYEWSDGRRMQKASTEDCYFTRDLYVAGIPLYITWQSWCGHWKSKCVGKPVLLTRNMVAKKYVEAALSNRSSLEKLYLLKEPPTCRKPSQMFQTKESSYTSNGKEPTNSELTLRESGTLPLLSKDSQKAFEVGQMPSCEV